MSPLWLLLFMSSKEDTCCNKTEEPKRMSTAEEMESDLRDAVKFMWVLVAVLGVMLWFTGCATTPDCRVYTHNGEQVQVCKRPGFVDIKILGKD